MRRSSLILFLTLSAAAAACGSTGAPSVSANTAAKTTIAVAPSNQASTTIAATTSTSVAATTIVAAATTAATTLPAIVEAAPVAEAAIEVDNGPGVGRLQIPKLGVDQRLQDDWALSALDYGPGLMPGSPQPGQTGNVVVAGHRTSHSKPFRYINELADGDEVIFTIRDKRYVYHVTGSLIVQPTDVWITNPTSDATATLFACHPVGSTAQRWVTRLKLAS